MRKPSPKQWEKAERLHEQQDVRVDSTTPDRIRARVKGDSGVYRVDWTRDGWDCDCEYRDYKPGTTCSHIAAVWLAIETAGGCDRNE